MIEQIYIEEQVLEHPRTQAILKRHADAQTMVVERYAQVFNSHAQNFRLQKQHPALILAAKQNQRVLPAPMQYETGGGANYYFSHMLNCLYDCRYCFLQGMLRSANYLLFVNYEEFAGDIAALARQHADDDKPAWFFSGYDCDSLALEPVSHFAAHFLDVFAELPEAVLELRTKSTQIRSLLKRSPMPNVVVAYSLSPADVAEAVEEGAPTLERRLDALQRLQQAGWRIGLRFDPVVWHADWQVSYAQLFSRVFMQLDSQRLDSVTLGAFRLPKDYYKTMRQLYPEHWLFAAGLQEQDKMISYSNDIENEMFAELRSGLLQYVSDEKLYAYPSSEQVNP